MKYLKYFLAFLFTSLLFYSCVKEKRETADNAKNIPSKSISEENVIEIKKIGSSELQERINNRNGKILFINVWATWCAPCIEEFPDLIKTAEEYKNKDIDFLSLSVDFESQVDSMLIPFLSNRKVKFPVLLLKEKDSESIINLLNKDWSGAIPATFIYDNKGNQKVFLEGAQSFNTFKQKIDSVSNL